MPLKSLYNQSGFMTFMTGFMTFSSVYFMYIAHLTVDIVTRELYGNLYIKFKFSLQFMPNEQPKMMLTGEKLIKTSDLMFEKPLI